MVMEKQTRGYERTTLSRRKIMINNFLGGLSWGLGTVIGATVIVGIIFYLLGKLGAIPVIGSFFGKIIKEVIPLK